MGKRDRDIDSWLVNRPIIVETTIPYMCSALEYNVEKLNLNRQLNQGEEVAAQQYITWIIDIRRYFICGLEGVRHDMKLSMRHGVEMMEVQTQSMHVKKFYEETSPLLDIRNTFLKIKPYGREDGFLFSFLFFTLAVDLLVFYL